MTRRRTLTVTALAVIGIAAASAVDWSVKLIWNATASAPIGFYTVEPADALARVQANAARNGITNVTTRDANVFDLLHELDQRGERFDTVILDPPAFAKSKDAVEKAARGYNEINRRALRILKPGGCLVTCSCSYHVHEDDFEAILAAAAADARATVTVVEKRRQARDHPVVLGVPETYYLKCLVLRRLE